MSQLSVYYAIIQDSLVTQKPIAAVFINGEIFGDFVSFIRKSASDMSLSSQRNYAQVVRDFILWHTINHHKFNTPQTRPHLIRAFTQDMTTGFYVTKPFPFLLKPKNKQRSVQLANHLLQFLDFIQTQDTTGSVNADLFRPRHSIDDVLRQLAHWRKRRENAFLGHTSKKLSDKKKAIKAKFHAPRPLSETKSFEKGHIPDLLLHGFRTQKYKPYLPIEDQFNLRDLLITLLLMGTGCRVSEVMHLWVGDIRRDEQNPNQVKITIPHPSDGFHEIYDPYKGRTQTITRRQFLKEHCNGQKPLNERSDGKHVGWKGSRSVTNENNELILYWVIPEFSQMFALLWFEHYLHKVRPKVSETPWAFLTKNAKPYTPKLYRETLQRAVERIGLISGKNQGNTPHAFRHMVGKIINSLKLNENEAMHILHHASPASQQVYRNKTSSELQKELQQDIHQRTNGIQSMPSALDDFYRFFGK